LPELLIFRAQAKMQQVPNWDFFLFHLDVRRDPKF
jgi:hypothetical protein